MGDMADYYAEREFYLEPEDRDLTEEEYQAMMKKYAQATIKKYKLSKIEKQYRKSRENNWRKIMSPKLKINKFYVAAEHIAAAIMDGHNDDWTHPTMEKALEHARTILNGNSDKKAVLVVEIKRIVKRAPQPIRVERV